MKRIYMGWLVILILVGVGLLAVALSPRWHGEQTTASRMEQWAKAQLARGLPPDPGVGQVTANLPEAMRLNMPILAAFNQHVHEHKGGPEQIERAEEEKAEHSLFAKIAADYKGALAVVEVSGTAAPASAFKAKVKVFPTAVIYGPQHRPGCPCAACKSDEPPDVICGAEHNEVWRAEGRPNAGQILAELSKLGIKPQRQADAAGAEQSRPAVSPRAPLKSRA